MNRSLWVLWVSLLCRGLAMADPDGAHGLEPRRTTEHRQPAIGDRPRVGESSGEEEEIDLEALYKKLGVQTEKEAAKRNGGSSKLAFPLFDIDPATTYKDHGITLTKYSVSMIEKGVHYSLDIGTDKKGEMWIHAPYRALNTDARKKFFLRKLEEEMVKNRKLRQALADAEITLPKSSSIAGKEDSSAPPERPLFP